MVDGTQSLPRLKEKLLQLFDGESTLWEEMFEWGLFSLGGWANQCAFGHGSWRELSGDNNCLTYCSCRAVVLHPMFIHWHTAFVPVRGEELPCGDLHY